MSIIEKAMQRLVAQTGHVGRESKSAAATAVSSGSARESVFAGDEDTVMQRESQQRVLEYLRLIGVLPGEDQDPRNKDEYRRIKRPLLANAFGRNVTYVENGRVIMITSSLPSEGKTHNSINLALSIAREMNHKVLLVDADVAKADVSRIFNVYDNKGLTDLLLDDTLNVDEVIMPSGIPDFSLLPAGHHHFDTTELLASERMRNLVAELAKRDESQIVLIDSPPLLVASDPQVLVSLAGQIVMVVEAVKTPRHIVTQALNSLHTEKPVNLILNKSNRSLGIAYYGAYNYGYGNNPQE